MSRNLNPLDASWLMVESRDTPMHVGGLLRFAFDAPPRADFFRRLIADFRMPRRVAAPWNQRLRPTTWMHPWPAWDSVDDIDVEHHVRHSALPAPAGERELGQFIARLHSQPLDLGRPPWECELIEGLADGREFAIYVKMHHALIDGVSGIKLLERSMAGDIDASRRLPPFWTIGSERAGKAKRRPAPTAAEAIAGLVEAIRSQVGNLPDIARAFGAMLTGLGSQERLAIPFEAPLSILNGRIHGQRRFATQRLALDRLRAVAAAGGGTLNDVVLALCGGALKRFLGELGELPAQPLTAGVPVSVRPKDDDGAGNAITFIIATLGTDIDDPAERLAAIAASTRRAKAHLLSLPRQAMTQYTIVLMAPYMLSLVTGVGGRTRPMFNVTISNVPGPDRPLYFRGARLQAAYPVSLVTHGQALNITCQSYDGHLAFGFTGCRDTLPHMQRLATYTGEALDELERAFGLVQPGAPVASPRKRAAKRAAKAAPADTAAARSPRRKAATKSAAAAAASAGAPADAATR